MKCVCRYCKKEIGDFKIHGALAMKRRTRSYDAYYFCKEGNCIDEYIKNKEQPKLNSAETKDG